MLKLHFFLQRWNRKKDFCKILLRNFILSCCIVGVFPSLALALNTKKELIGELSLSDILIQPKFYAVESGEQKFELERSYFFFSWKIKDQLSTHFGVGQYGLINANERLQTNLNMNGNEDQLRFFEAYAEWDSNYGVLRAGLIPLLLGWEGSHRESEWQFPRTLFYENKNFGLRDLGASYSVDSNGFYMQFAIHNGENGEDIDGKLWHSARWGWKNDRDMDISFSATNGKYSESKLLPVSSYSYFNSYFNFVFSKFTVLAEGFYAKQEQENTSVDTKFWDYHLDLERALSSNISALARYEAYDPDSNAPQDAQNRWIFGVSFYNDLKTSNLYLWGIVNKEQGASSSNNEIQLVWKVRSLSFF